MRRHSAVPSAALAFGALAFLGWMLRELYGQMLRGEGGVLGIWFSALIGDRLSPFGGRLLGGTASQTIGWLLGLVIALVVVVAVVALVTVLTSDAIAHSLAAWLGTVLGAGLGAFLSVPVALRDFSSITEPMAAVQYYASLSHGAYWGVFAGLPVAVITGIVASRGRSRAASRVAPDAAPIGDSSDPSGP